MDLNLLENEIYVKKQGLLEWQNFQWHPFYITGCTRCLPGAVSWERTHQEDPDSAEDDPSLALSTPLPEDEGQLYHHADNMEGLHCQKTIPNGKNQYVWLMPELNCLTELSFYVNFLSVSYLW